MQFAKYLLSAADHIHLTEQQETFRDAVDSYNVNRLVQIKESGYVPDKSDMELMATFFLPRVNPYGWGVKNLDYKKNIRSKNVPLGTKYW